MKFTLKTVDNDGILIAENKLEIKPKSILIQKIPSNISTQHARYLHDNLSEILEKEDHVVTMYKGIELQVLEFSE